MIVKLIGVYMKPEFTYRFPASSLNEVLVIRRFAITVRQTQETSNFFSSFLRDKISHLIRVNRQRANQAIRQPGADVTLFDLVCKDNVRVLLVENLMHRMFFIIGLMF